MGSDKTPYDAALLEKGGLVIAGDKGHYDRFRGRLIFPICDEQGRVVGFSGRVLSLDQKGGKYINSPETPIFSKSLCVQKFFIKIWYIEFNRTSRQRAFI